MAALNPPLTPRLVRPLRIVAIGDELLRGDRADSNSPWLAARLGALGWTPDGIQQLGDDGGALSEALARWREEGGCLILGGGLGPTPDDRTRELVAAALGVELAEDSRAARWIAEREERLGYKFSPLTHRQALLPRGALPLANPQGTAPGFWLPGSASEGFLLVLPGVPGEYRALCESLFPPASAGASAENWLLVGLGEDKLASLAADLPGREQLGSYPSFEGLRLRVPGGIDGEELARRLAPYLVSRTGESLEAVVMGELARRGQTLAVAESCTGGLLGARISRVPGASAVWLGGVLAYSNAVKRDLLGLSESLLQSEGAVSEAAARAMAAGARQRLGSDWSLSITGIAGPGGGVPGKPVGTLHLGLGKPDGSTEHRQHRAGWDRENNRRFAVLSALGLLWKALKEAP